MITFDFQNIIDKIKYQLLNKRKLTEALYKSFHDNILQGMYEDRVEKDPFREWFKGVSYEELNAVPERTENPIYSGAQGYEQRRTEFFSTNIKEIGHLRAVFKDPNKVVKAKIKINTPSSIKSIIRGQATGIKRWDIKKYMLKNGEVSRKLPLYERRGKPMFRTMHMNSKGWIYPTKIGTLLPQEILFKDDNTLVIKTTISKLEKTLEKMKRFGTITIKI